MVATLSPRKAAVAKAGKVADRLKGTTAGALIDRMWAKREEKRKAEEAVKAIEAEIATIEEQLMEKMTAEGLDRATGTKASASISATVVGTIEDWDTLCAYVKKTGYFQLFQRRMSDAAFRELLDLGKKVPGVSPFTKKRINVRTLST